MARGKFITFEGGEGCGKSTQVKRLKEELTLRGYEVLLTREPGGTKLAEEIRHLIKDQTFEAPTDRCELLLFLAARAQLVREVINPARERGAWVISDRFSDSTFAYQGYGRGLNVDELKRMNDFACEGLKPDLTFLLEVSEETSLNRRLGRERATSTQADRIESAGREFHHRLAEGFKCLALAEPERIKVIDANLSVDEVWEQIWKLMKPIV